MPTLGKLLSLKKGGSGLKRIRRISLSVWILAGLALGILTGLVLQKTPWVAETFLQPIGTLFLNVVKLLIVPLVFSSITVGVCGLGDAKSVGRVGGKTIVFYLLTTAVAVTVGLAAGNLFPVGRGMDLTAPVSTVGEQQTLDVISTLLNMVPSNPVAALAEGNMLQIIVTALILGGGILIAGDRGRPLFLVMESLADVMYALTGAVMKFAPLAVLALIAPVVAQYGPSVLLDLLGVIALVYGACAVHALVVYSTAVSTLGRTSPLRFFKECAPAALFAFSSSSSAATLPFALDAAERLGASHPVRSFVLPLGATINMDGTAIYQGVCALFIANAYGIPLSLSQQLTIVLTCTLASIGTAGVPGAGTIMLSMVLTSAGLPVEGVSLVWGVDRVLDMARTTLNVTGDIACSVVVSRTEPGHGEKQDGE